MTGQAFAYVVLVCLRWNSASGGYDDRGLFLNSNGVFKCCLSTLPDIYRDQQPPYFFDSSMPETLLKPISSPALGSPAIAGYQPYPFMPPQGVIDLPSSYDQYQPSGIPLYDEADYIYDSSLSDFPNSAQTQPLSFYDYFNPETEFNLQIWPTTNLQNLGTSSFPENLNSVPNTNNCGCVPVCNCDGEANRGVGNVLENLPNGRSFNVLDAQQRETNTSPELKSDIELIDILNNLKWEPFSILPSKLGISGRRANTPNNENVALSPETTTPPPIRPIPAQSQPEQIHVPQLEQLRPNQAEQSSPTIPRKTLFQHQRQPVPVNEESKFNLGGAANIPNTATQFTSLRQPEQSAPPPQQQQKQQQQPQQQQQVLAQQQESPVKPNLATEELQFNVQPIYTLQSAQSPTELYSTQVRQIEPETQQQPPVLMISNETTFNSPNIPLQLQTAFSPQQPNTIQYLPGDSRLAVGPPQNVQPQYIQPVQYAQPVQPQMYSKSVYMAPVDSKAGRTLVLAN